MYFLLYRNLYPYTYLNRREGSMILRSLLWRLKVGTSRTPLMPTRAGYMQTIHNQPNKQLWTWYRVYEGEGNISTIAKIEMKGIAKTLIILSLELKFYEFWKPKVGLDLCQIPGVFQIPIIHKLFSHLLLPTFLLTTSGHDLTSSNREKEKNTHSKLRL